jgi:hypothetical protein
MIVRHLVERGVRGILAVDADPNSCLGLALGVETGITVADIREQTRDRKVGENPGEDRGRAFEYALQRAVAEAEGVALTDPWKHIAKAAAAKPASELQANLAFFPTPFGDSGSLTHLREENLTVGDLFRAAFVNMADNYYSSALRLSPAQGWRRLVFSGGLAQKLELLRGLVAEKFQSEYRLCSAMDDTLQGLLVLALVVSGRAASAQAAMEHLRRAQAPILTNKSGAR